MLEKNAYCWDIGKRLFHTRNKILAQADDPTAGIPEIFRLADLAPPKEEEAEDPTASEQSVASTIAPAISSPTRPTPVVAPASTGDSRSTARQRSTESSSSVDAAAAPSRAAKAKPKPSGRGPPGTRGTTPAAATGASPKVVPGVVVGTPGDAAKSVVQYIINKTDSWDVENGAVQKIEEGQMRRRASLEEEVQLGLGGAGGGSVEGGGAAATAEPLLRHGTDLLESSSEEDAPPSKGGLPSRSRSVHWDAQVEEPPSGRPQSRSSHLRRPPPRDDD